MKTTSQFFSLMTMVFIISATGTADAQGRGHRHKPAGHADIHGYHKDDYRKTHKHHHDDHCRVSGRSHRHSRVHDHRVVVHHGHDQHSHAVHHRPRYIYYRDYDVYYDMGRRVYISFSGRNWTVSTDLPLALHHVDVRRTVRMEVDYEHDDLPVYLERDRPSYRRIFTGS